MDPNIGKCRGHRRTWPPTSPALSLGMLVCVWARLVRLALASRSWLLKLVSSCQGRSLCLQAGAGWEAGQAATWTWGLQAPSLASLPLYFRFSRLEARVTDCSLPEYT